MMIVGFALILFSGTAINYLISIHSVNSILLNLSTLIDVVRRKKVGNETTFDSACKNITSWYSRKGL